MSDPLQHFNAIRNVESGLLEPEEGDDEQSILDAEINAEDMAWDRMRQEGF